MAAFIFVEDARKNRRRVKVWHAVRFDLMDGLASTPRLSSGGGEHVLEPSKLTYERGRVLVSRRGRREKGDIRERLC